MRQILVDCNTLLYAAMHSMGDLSHKEMRTGVMFGFFLKLLSIAREFESNYFVFCWDSKHSVRRKEYPNYKRKRRESRAEATPQEEARYLSMIEQSVRLRKEILPELGFKNSFLQAGYESDDLMAYIVQAYIGDWLMITSDNDMYQCLAYCDIYSPQTKKLMTEDIFKQKYKIETHQWAYAKAIGGCDGDNVIGIEGVSDPKRESSKALKYIRGELTKGKIFERIVAHMLDIVAPNQKLVSLPFPGVNHMELQQCTFNKADFRVVFDDLGFQSFLRDFSKWEIFF